MTVVDRPTRSLLTAPHSTEAEESVLGAILLSADAVNIVLERLHAEDFYVPAHTAIFDVIMSLFDANQPIDAITVSEGLRAQKMLDRVGGVDYLTRLIDAVPTTSNVEHYVRIVDDHAVRRRLMAAAAEVSTNASVLTEPIEQILDRSEQVVFQVAERRVGGGLLPIDPMLGPIIERAEELNRNGRDVTGIPTGYRDLDRKLSGLHPANLLILAARPAMGKSALALNIAQNVAVQGNPVAVFSLEMSREEMVTRMMCAQGRIDSQKLRTGRLDERDFTKLSNAASVLYKKPVFVDDSPGLTVTEIRAKCRRMARRHGLRLVIVDYLQLMQGSGGENRQQEIAVISRSLKNLARELDVPVIALSQLNRSLESREDKRPRLADLRESGSLEQDADVVMFIYRHEYYHPEAIETRGVAEVMIAKHRQGSTGKVDMTFLPEFTLFSDMGRDTAVM